MRVILWLSLCFANAICAQTPFYNEKPEGFLWGKVPVSEEPKSSEPATALKDQPQVQQKSYTEMMEARERQGKELLSKMQMLKTPEAAEEWMQWEDSVWSEAEEIGKLTEYVKWYRNPSINYDLKHPTNHLAHEVYLAEEKANQVKAVQNFAKSHGLLFFFSSNCQYCHVMVPIMKRIADQYGIDILGISLDGGTISGLENSKEDSGLAVQLMGEHIVTPAIFALNPSTGDVFAVLYGAASEKQLEEQIMNAVEYSKLYPEMVKKGRI